MSLPLALLAGVLLAQAGSGAPGSPGSSGSKVQPMSVETIRPAQQPREAAQQAAQAGLDAPAQHVRITVRAIAAGGDAAAGEDPKLAPISQNLRAFGDQFRFRSYHLVEEQTFELDWKSPAQMELPGSRSLQLTPRQLSAEGNIKVHLELLGEHPAHSRKLHTDYSIHRGGTIFVGGLLVDPANPQAGTLLLAITQAVEK